MSTSIDDLLRHDDEQPPPRAAKQPTRAGAWVRLVLAAAGLTTVTVVGLRFANLELSALGVFAGFLALLAVRRVAAAVAPPAVPRAGAGSGPGEEDGSYRWGTRDALRGAVNPWERALGWTEGNPERFAERVLPMLGELVDERLRQRHGLTRESDPARARALLGEPLWKFLTVRTRRAPAPSDWAAVVAELEKL